MENLEYLKEVKELSGLKQYILGTECKELGEQIEIRKVLALEIIAEELIKTNGILENIESATFIKLRG